MAKGDQRLRIFISIQLVWLAIVSLLGAWWGSVLIRQAQIIADLQVASGHLQEAARLQLAHTQRMVRWEAPVFFALIVGCAFAVFWIYWRDAQRTKSLSAFFAAFTHELRTPLASLRLQAETIADSLEKRLSPGDLPKRLIEDTVRLEDQVDRALELARLEGGGPVCTSPVPLRSWLDRFLQKGEIAPSSVQIEVDRGLVIQGDLRSLHIIFRNVFENSIRHASHASNDSIASQGSKGSPVCIHVSGESKDNWVHLKLRDNGPGFSGNSKKIFQLFERGEKSQGAGVGLYLVKILMERMGGSVEALSGPGFALLLKFREGGSDVGSEV